MGDVVSSHLEERKEVISGHTRRVLDEFDDLYQQQYALALFNKVRFEIEGIGGPQSQLLHRKVPLAIKSIFSGDVYQCMEENKKWRIRWLYIPDSYSIESFESKAAFDKGVQPKGTISCAGYRVLTSVEEYLELLNNSLPDVKAKACSGPFLKCATQFPLLLWHPYARHYYFSVTTEKEQNKWLAVFQDCIRYSNNGLPEESKVETLAFTDTVRLYRQGKEQYGTWEMMCGMHPQILANLVMESLVPELRDLIGPRLKGSLYQRQRTWVLILDAVYRQVLSQAQNQYEALVHITESKRPTLEASIRTDMDQIITSKEHVTAKIRALVLPKAEHLLKESVQPYVSSILDAIMEPTSRGFAEVRDIFFHELVDMSRDVQNDDSKEKLAEHMEKVSMLAYHAVKMRSCYEKLEEMQLEGLQQRFDVSSPSVFVQRAQILMRQQMDNAVFTFEQLLHQSLDTQEREDLSKDIQEREDLSKDIQEREDLSKVIQRCQDRVIKKYDHDSSTVRKRFSKEAILQIIVPHMLKQLTPSCSEELPHFRELIFADFSHFILVENIFEEVVLQSVMKDVTSAVHDAVVQRRHNLYQDSMVLTCSDPNLHLLEEKPPINWGAHTEGEDTDLRSAFKRSRQVVSMVRYPHESCLEVLGVEGIPEEEGEEDECISSPSSSPSPTPDPSSDPSASFSPSTALDQSSSFILSHSSSPELSSSPVPVSTTEASSDSVREIRNLINPLMEVRMPASQLDGPLLSNGMFPHEDEDEDEDKLTGLPVTEEQRNTSLLRASTLEEGRQAREVISVQETKNIPPEGDEDSLHKEISQWKLHNRLQEQERELAGGDVKLVPPSLSTKLVQCAVSHGDNSAFQPLTSVALGGDWPTISEAFRAEDSTIDPEMVTFGHGDAAFHGSSVTGEVMANALYLDPVSEV